MNEELLHRLAVITPEEQDLLQGGNINRSLYYRSEELSRRNEVDASLLLKKGKLIDIRPNTRFVRFPRHTHNFVEVVYMCHGTTTHIIDGRKIVLHTGDLLFMNQHAQQEILPAGKDDIAVNFLILPEFFKTAMHSIIDESSQLRNFLISCLTDQNMGGNYLYCHTANILPISNLMESLIWIMQEHPPNEQPLCQEIMALLFLLLLNYTERIQMPASSYKQELLLKLFSYIDRQYQNASLTLFCKENQVDLYFMERLIHKQSGHTFQQLLAEKRMKQAALLLKNTDLSTVDISYLIGYENTSYFHRLFKNTYHMTPKQYRKL